MCMYIALTNGDPGSLHELEFNSQLLTKDTPQFVPQKTHGSRNTAF